MAGVGSDPRLANRKTKVHSRMCPPGPVRRQRCGCRCVQMWSRKHCWGSARPRGTGRALKSKPLPGGGAERKHWILLRKGSPRVSRAAGPQGMPWGSRVPRQGRVCLCAHLCLVSARESCVPVCVCPCVVCAGLVRVSHLLCVGTATTLLAGPPQRCCHTAHTPSARRTASGRELKR